MVSTHDFGEIVLTEDEEIVGLRFRDTKDADSGFEVNLFIAKAGGLDVELTPLVQRMIQYRGPSRYSFDRPCIGTMFRANILPLATRSEKATLSPGLMGFSMSDRTNGTFSPLATAIIPAPCWLTFLMIPTI